MGKDEWKSEIWIEFIRILFLTLVDARRSSKSCCCYSLYSPLTLHGAISGGRSFLKGDAAFRLSLSESTAPPPPAPSSPSLMRKGGAVRVWRWQRLTAMRPRGQRHAALSARRRSGFPLCRPRADGQLQRLCSQPRPAQTHSNHFNWQKCWRLRPGGYVTTTTAMTASFGLKGMWW